MTANIPDNRNLYSQHTAQLLFACVFVGFTFFLLSQIGAEAKFSSKGKFFAQPALWPAIGLVGMLAFGLGHVWSVWSSQRRSRALAARAQRPNAGPESGVTGIYAWLGVFEYYVWFMVYVKLVPVMGYLVSTILFTTLLAIRAGYRSLRTLGLAALTGITTVVVFKTLLEVRIPAGAWYDSLPDAFRNFMITNF